MTINQAIENIRAYSTVQLDDGDGREICGLQEEIAVLEEANRRPTANEVCAALEKDVSYSCKQMPNGEIWFRACDWEESEDEKWVPLVETYGNEKYTVGAYLSPETLALVSRFYKQDK